MLSREAIHYQQHLKETNISTGCCDDQQKTLEECLNMNKIAVRWKKEMSEMMNSHTEHPLPHPPAVPLWTVAALDGDGGGGGGLWSLLSFKRETSDWWTDGQIPEGLTQTSKTGYRGDHSLLWVALETAVHVKSPPLPRFDHTRIDTSEWPQGNAAREETRPARIVTASQPCFCCDVTKKQKSFYFSDSIVFAKLRVCRVSV